MNRSFQHYPVIALDTETTGLHFMRDEMFGFSLATGEWSGYWDIREQPNALSWLKDELSTYRGMVVFFNATFDLKFLSRKGVNLNLDRVDDAAIRACLIDEHLGRNAYSLDALAKRYLKKEKISDIYRELADMFGGLATRNVQMPRLQKAPSSLVAPYAIVDAELTLELWQDQEKEIEHQGIHAIAEFERRTIPRVLAQETQGVRVDIEEAAKQKALLDVRIEDEKSTLGKIVGFPLNVNSSPQIKAHYAPKESGAGFVLADGTPTKVTPKGNASIDNDVLQSIAHKDPVAAQIIKIRSLIRTADTFLGKHIIASSFQGRVYPNINQVASEDGGTKTGRFSYTAPALQQIPNRNKEIAAIVKPCFLPDEGEVWLDCDMNSFEVRIFAHLVGAYNDAIAKVYSLDPYTDFHQWVADLMSVPRNPRPEGGANAKQLNLSMIFNSGNGSIARQLGYPTTPASFLDNDNRIVHYDKPSAEAMRVIDTYHHHVQGVKRLVDAAKRAIIDRRFLRTMYGRKLRFNKQMNKAYKGSGILIQSTAADINKDNWNIVDEAINGRGRMVLNTHDSYSMSVQEGKEDEVWRDVKGAIENAPRPHDLRVPLILDKNGVGPNWWAALQG